MGNDLITLITGIISFIALICFFVITANVSTIKDRTKKKGSDYWVNQYRKHLFFSQQPEALKALQEAFWCDMNTAHSRTYINSKMRTNEIKKVIERYQEKIIALGGTMQTEEFFN